jgi:zinc ribbon protein
MPPKPAGCVVRSLPARLSPVFCVSCGTANPDHAKFCFACGEKIAVAAAAPPPQAAPVPDTKIPVIAEPPVKTANSGAPADLKQTLPYRWGKFQGWVSLVTGLFAAGFAISWVLGRNDALSETATNYAIASPLLFVSGYVFLWRKNFSVAITYVWMVVIGVEFLVVAISTLTNTELAVEKKTENITEIALRSAVGLAIWAACRVYYRKRQPEFT